MRVFRDALAAFALTAMASVATAAPGLAETLLAGMAKTPPVSTPFVL